MIQHLYLRKSETDSACYFCGKAPNDIRHESEAEPKPLRQRFRRSLGRDRDKKATHP